MLAFACVIVLRNSLANTHCCPRILNGSPSETRLDTVGDFHTYDALMLAAIKAAFPPNKVRTHVRLTQRDNLSTERVGEGGEMASKVKIRVNERAYEVSAAADTPLLYVLSNELQLQGPRFGCGLAQCGSCSVLVNGEEIRSCVTPVSAVTGKSVTTLEGLPHWYAKQKKLAKAPALHPVQQAMIDEQAVQCGYCFNGMIIQAAELLAKTPQPTEGEIRTAMNGHLCRCGSYPRVIKAIQRAAGEMQAAGVEGRGVRDEGRETRGEVAGGRGEGTAAQFAEETNKECPQALKRNDGGSLVSELKLRPPKKPTSSANCEATVETAQEMRTIEVAR
jgi:aerobic-type carbon monoxide dehydrogenase small subunit (CoxS/CutS family)